LKVLIIGSGYMANEYCNVLNDLDVEICVVGRSKINCEKLKVQFPQISIISGGIENYDQVSQYQYAIITSNVEYLFEHAKLVLESGIKNILVEKPGGKNLIEIENLYSLSKIFKSNLFIAYNRRFYSSVDKFRELLSSDTKILSFNFEFTEWPHALELLENQEAVKENLLYANSTHLIDLAFFLCGKPSKLIAISTDKLDWHKKAIYAGAGVTENGSIFSYQANWKGPGRWGIEIITENFRYYFRPLEELWIQKQRTVKLEKLEIDNSIDVKYKSGLFNQVNAFLFDQNDDRLINIENQYSNCKLIYETMLDGNYQL
jgi:predicted dehydrogenase